MVEDHIIHQKNQPPIDESYDELIPRILKKVGVESDFENVDNTVEVYEECKDDDKDCILEDYSDEDNDDDDNGASIIPKSRKFTLAALKLVKPYIE